MEAHGLDVWPEAIQPGDFTIKGGRRAMARLLERDPPTAVFGASDAIAIGAIQEAKARGFRVPQDLSVVGFDDIDFAEVFDPPLTTIFQPRREMGRKAMQALQRLIRDPRTPSDDVRLDFKLIVRESAAPPNPGPLASAGETSDRAFHDRWLRYGSQRSSTGLGPPERRRGRGRVQAALVGPRDFTEEQSNYLAEKGKLC